MSIGVQMTVAQDIKSSLMQFNELLAPYLPPRDTWNPADEVIYQPRDVPGAPGRSAGYAAEGDQIYVHAPL